MARAQRDFVEIQRRGNGWTALATSTVFVLSLFLPGVSAQIVSGVYERYYTLDGTGEGDTLGGSVVVAGAGDVNGDDVPDVIMGTPLADPGGFRDAGSAYVYSGKDGALLWQFHGNLAGDRMGSSVAAAGDVNGDGFDDVIVGAPRASIFATLGAYSGGSAYVYSGKTGRSLWQFDGVPGSPRGDLLGWSVAGAGDVNRDGFDDVIVGAPWADFAYVYSGKDGAQIWRFEGAPGPGFIADALGASVAGAGDVNRDGFADVIVGAYLAGPDQQEGSAYVYSGRDGTRIWQFDGQGVLGGHLVIGQGWSVAGAGDVNRDGFPDVIVGAPGRISNSPASQTIGGSATVYSGRDGTRIWRFDGAAAADNLGWSVAGAGDVNLDGFGDVIVGAPQLTGEAGYVYAYSGKDGTLIRRLDGGANGRLGSSVAGTGDLNQDTVSDAILGVDRGPAGAPSAFVNVYQPAVVAYGTGLAGSLDIVPVIGTGGTSPRVGSSEFKIRITAIHGGAPSMIAGSLARADTPLSGGTLHGDFLTPGVFATWSLIADGPLGFPIFGSATLPVPIPNDPTLSGVSTYWQGFVMDGGSPIGFSHTGGLWVIVRR